jgi:hypothetical protein
VGEAVGERLDDPLLEIDARLCRNYGVAVASRNLAEAIAMGHTGVVCKKATTVPGDQPRFSTINVKYGFQGCSYPFIASRQGSVPGSWKGF